MTQDMGVALRAAPSPCGPSPVPGLGASHSVTNAVERFRRIADEVHDLGKETVDIRADIPEPTCPQIDEVLRDISDVRREADRWSRLRTDPDGYYGDDLTNFASDVDTALWSMPDKLEGLRACNDKLRSGVHGLGSACHSAGEWLMKAADALEEAACEIEDLRAALASVDEQARPEDAQRLSPKGASAVPCADTADAQPEVVSHD